MKVLFVGQRKELEVTGCKQVKILLERLGVNPESVLVVRDGALLTDDDLLSDSETIQILPVMSGGA